MDAEHNPWRTHHIQEVYENPWIRVTHRDVTTPGGSPGIYGVVHFKNQAIGVVPVDQQGHTWLVGQYRYPLDRYSWEIPEGGCPLGTDPLEAAKRELREETGLRAECWEKILDFALSNSVSDETGAIYLATGIEEGESEPEDTERLRLRRIPLHEALEMVTSGEISDAMSIMGLLRAAQYLREGDFKYSP
ncbi:MAG: hypothetical protein RL386_374 [Bacteroidota bacterium]